MTYQALARKWRPQDFSSLIGQEPVVTALRNALADRRIAQAYLFSGIRGVGKTTAARILAKALNCEQGPAPEPCSKCLSCREIAAGANLDVQEIDAATYSKVEQVRELTESLRYGAARERYKVVILDEVHRLSRQAFDALLKILEEPPRHLVFVFATTEIEAVPATILSRCQEYHFRRVPVPLLADHLRELCGAEGIDASEAALHLRARASEGSVRDAVALLDQLATYGSGKVGDQEAARLLGHFDLDLLHQLLQGLLAGDGASLAAVVAELEAVGGDPRQLYSRLLDYCRGAVHLALGASPPELPTEELTRLGETVRSTAYENLLRLLQHLLASEPLVRRSDLPGLALEVSLLRAAELPKLVRVEELLGAAPSGADTTSRGTGGDAGPTSIRPTPASRPATTPPPATKTPRQGSSAEKGQAERRKAAGAPPGGQGAASSEEPMTRFVRAVGRRRQLLAACLEDVEAMRFVDGGLEIVHSPEDQRLERALQRQGNREALDEAVREVWGPDAGWRSVAGGAAPAPVAAEPAATPPADPTLQAVLDIFDGSVEAVANPAAPEEDR
jgi:DNA polymerase III subunit gamma/tau